MSKLTKTQAALLAQLERHGAVSTHVYGGTGQLGGRVRYQGMRERDAAHALVDMGFLIRVRSSSGGVTRSGYTVFSHESTFAPGPKASDEAKRVYLAIHKKTPWLEEQAA